jgi:hypothetical protein
MKGLLLLALVGARIVVLQSLQSSCELTHGVQARQESHLGKLFDFAHKLGCSSHRLYIPGIYIVHVIEMHYVDLCR